MEKQSRPFWFRLIRGILIIYAGLCVFSCTMADKLIFMPQRPGYTLKAPALIKIQTSKDETVTAFYYPPKPGKPTILYSHGNAEDIGNSTGLYQDWRNSGWGVLAYDYPGYGHATGSPTEASCERAIEASWNFLTVEKSLLPSDIIVVGRSVGSGPSVWLVDNHRPAGLVLISPFTSTFAVRSPAQYILPGNRFPNLKRIRTNDTPLLVIHGEDDYVIPASHGRTLHQASPATMKRFVSVPNTGHNDLRAMDILFPISEFVGELRRNQN
ncbi:alpha/beta hydrolase [Haloferula sp.]|uniref:alpha/beta hydrolase n=1 Tax=Haloferula sp. TaxID=2497595 RepID=UPI00329D2AD3